MNDYKETDTEKWSSVHFVCHYDDREKFPWRLKVKKTGRHVGGFMRRFVAHHRAKELDKIIEDVLE